MKWPKIFCLVFIPLFPITGMAQHPFSACEKSTSIKGKSDLGLQIKNWEVNQVVRFSKCDLAWVGRQMGKNISKLLISNLNGTVYDTMTLPPGMESQKLVSIGRGQFLFIDMHVEFPRLVFSHLERKEMGWTLSNSGYAPIPMEVSGLNSYLNQALETKAKEAKLKVGEYLFGFHQVFFIDNKVFVLLKKSILGSPDNSDNNLKQWFLLEFDWISASRQLNFKQTTQLYFKEMEDIFEICQPWMYQPILCSKNEKQFLINQRAKVPFWYSVEKRTLTPAFQVLKQEHQFVVTTAQDPEDLHCLAWKVGTTFIPGLDNKAVKSDKPVAVGVESVRIKERYLPEKPRSIEEESILETIYLAEGDKGNLWFLPSKNWCNISAGQAGVFEFSFPQLLNCQ